MSKENKIEEQTTETRKINTKTNKKESNITTYELPFGITMYVGKIAITFDFSSQKEKKQ